MPYKVVEFRETPNPNAVKCVLDVSPGATPRSYRRPQDAAGDPLADALFGVPGVVGLLIHDGWITVTKSPAVPWKTVKAAVQRVLEVAP